MVEAEAEAGWEEAVEAEKLAGAVVRSSLAGEASGDRDPRAAKSNPGLWPDRAGGTEPQCTYERSSLLPGAVTQLLGLSA